jgi:hypothetical protein
MRRYKDPPGIEAIEALAKERTSGEKVMVKYLLARDWSRLRETIERETQRLLALFPRLGKRIVWDMLQWRILSRPFLVPGLEAY